MKFPLITLAAVAAAHGHTLTPSSVPHASLHAPAACVRACARISAATAVTGVSVVPGSGHADVVVGVESPVEIQDFTLDAPFRVVIDLKGATLSGSPSAYDRVARGGITDIRVSQFRPNVVRLVLQLDGTHAYEVKRGGNEVRIAVSGGAPNFAAWHGDRLNTERDNGSNGGSEDAPAPVQRQERSYATAVAQPSSIRGQQPSTQPRITVTYQDADIKDVIAAFATFAGRTIVVGKDVGGTVTAEIRNQPWDVALRAILQGQGLAAAEDPASGIITVDSYANVQARQALEPLVTQLIPINYAKADSLVPVVTKLLARDCTSSSPTAAVNSGAAGGEGGTSGSTTCITRGAVASNPGTNTLIVTETPSRIGGIINYVQNLDVRTPQVAIRAKIIFVNRSDIENLGLSYDIGSRNQFFSQLVSRTDPTTLKPIDTNGDGVPDGLGGGTPVTGNQILLGGNTLSAIANASSRIAAPALSLVYSAAIGKFSLTSFLDALKEVRLADLQAEPSIVTVDNREARIQVGQQVPLRTLDASSSGGALGAIPRATVTTKDVGIILRVTPHITNNRQILMDVHAENSDAQLASSDIGYVFNTQMADNRLLVEDGETAVIGGLTVTSVTQTKTGIPILVDLPLVGRLFGVTGRSEEKRDLLILITPHVIDAGERVGARGQ